MPVPGIIHARWPELHARLAAIPPEAGGECRIQGGRRRLLVKGQSLVSADPRREAERWAEGSLAGLGDARCAHSRLHLLGHGVGWELAALLARGVPEVVLHAADLPVLRLALEHWECPEALADPRLDIVAGRECRADLARPGDGVLELPLWRRLFPEELASRRVALGLTRAAALSLRVLVVEPLHGGSLPMARSAAAALRDLGHEVRSVSFAGMDGARAAFQSFADRRPGGAPLAGEFTRLLAAMILVEARAFAPDLVLGLAQSPFTPETARQLREAGVRTAFWFVEDWETLDYWQGLHGHFDLFLTIQRGRFHQALARLAGAPVRYLPACADPGLCYPDAWPGDDPPRLSFVGAGYHNRERLFLQLLDLPLRIWGSDWRPHGPLARLLQADGRRTTPDENRRIFSASAVNLNLHSSSYHEGVNPDGDFVNPRTFEILACGGFQLVDHRALMDELLRPGRDLVCFRDARELRELARHYLERPREREPVAAAGRRAVLARHTYRHRLAELLELFLLEQADAFPRAARRQVLDPGAADAELEAWLGSLPATLPRELDAVASWLRRGAAPLDRTGATLLYMQELRDWARAKGVERALEHAREQAPAQDPAGSREQARHG